MQKSNRRDFLKKSAFATAGAIAVPTIVSGAAVSRDNPPSRRINIGQIGCGRMGRGDMMGVLKFDNVRIIAVADVDSKRARDGKVHVESFYARKGKPNEVNVKVYTDYKELLANKDIDAVVISTPDHWHAQIAMEAALAGKDIYLQKPAALTIAEGRQMSDVIHRTGSIFQQGSQQRSAAQFRFACELVRNGRIGEIKTIKIGLPGDPGGNEEPEMPVPPNLDYDMWLGSTERVYYTEKRVHPQDGYSRPGWLRCEQFGAGMITGWGSHHLDIAHWGMGTEYTGPIEVEGQAKFPKSGLWNVHGDFLIKAKYANGADMLISGDYPNGVRFEGTDGWIFVTRGNYQVTDSDPVVFDQNRKSLDASDPKILTTEIGENEIQLMKSSDHYGNWLESVLSRRQPIAPAEVGHRSCSACLLSHISMKLPGKLKWDPVHERFIDNDEANNLVGRPQRWPYGTNYVL